MADCEECNRYIQGFVNGARSVEPEIEIRLAYLADDSEALAFGDATAANTFADAFIEVYQPDVLLPVAHGASIGMIQAACDHGILAVGTDIDVTSVHPEFSECVLGSITRDVATAVRHSVYDYSTGRIPRLREMTLSDGYVDLTNEWSRMSALPGDVSGRYEDARTALITGVVDACPVDCGKPVALDGSEAGQAPADGGTDEAPEASPEPAGG
jgi:basic membrane lipoprotein Med (substrate-binding protein (PBP1-ABC) superfamily)